MNRQFETIALSSRIVHVAVPVVMFAITAWFALLTFQTPLRWFGLWFLVAAAAPCGYSLWWELRIPRFVVFTEGACELRCFGGSVTVRDGELESIQAGLLTRLYPGAAPSRVILRFRSGSRSLYTNSRQYPQLIEELRVRNPSAQTL